MKLLPWIALLIALLTHSWTLVLIILVVGFFL